MIMNSKGKLFGKISIVDILVVAVIVIVAAGIAFRFSGNKGKAVVTGNTFTYTVEVNNVRQATYDAVEKSVGGHFFSCEKTGDDMGVLESFDAEPGTLMVEKADGTAVLAEVPGNYNLKLHFKIDGKINDNGYYTSLMRGVNVGAGYTIKSKYSTVFGTVIQLSE